MKTYIRFSIKMTSLSVLVAGCVINPKYSDPNIIYNEQLQKYPQSSEQIQQNKEAFKDWQAKEISKTLEHENYIIKAEKTSGWSVGDPEAAFHVGHNKYKYHHKIRIKFVCNKNEFLPTPAPLLKVNWKISDSIFGMAQTGRNGELLIHFASSQKNKFNDITLNLENVQFVISLHGDLIVYSKIESCTS